MRSFVFLPRGIPHSWDVNDGEAVVVLITVPGGFEDFLREFHEAEGTARNDVATRYGVEFLS